ncbi:uncharacterized protein LODBEIA_P04500 [Lodderomyces beijingensis]|uniref:peptidyl-tRNA hydrolase n=1 Tax=Lodderomyces beijingensis TaxID=1775926 RepID=A0ABP0ZHC3_9ASCO
MSSHQATTRHGIFRMIRALVNSYFPLPVRATRTNLHDTKCIFIVSIGNFEPEYSGTRHNVAHRVLDQLIERYWKEHILSQNSPYYQSSKYRHVVLFKSDSTFMNLQGRVIANHFQQLPAGSVLVVLHDELERQAGRYDLRRPGTSSRGHNGLKSIDGYYKGKYHKIGIGIGRPGKHESIADYVLSPMTQDEIKATNNAVPQIVREIEGLIEQEFPGELDS